MNELVQLGRNFDFKMRRDNRKISYEHLLYESVDNNSLLGYISNIRGKNNSGHKGLIAFLK